MAVDYERIRKAYEFFKTKFQDGEDFKKEELTNATGWKPNTTNTYLNKNYWHEYRRDLGNGHHRVVNFQNVTFEDFKESHTQVK